MYAEAYAEAYACASALITACVHRHDETTLCSGSAVASSSKRREDNCDRIFPIFMKNKLSRIGAREKILRTYVHDDERYLWCVRGARTE